MGDLGFNMGWHDLGIYMVAKKKKKKERWKNGESREREGKGGGQPCLFTPKPLSFTPKHTPPPLLPHLSLLLALNRTFALA